MTTEVGDSPQAAAGGESPQLESARSQKELQLGVSTWVDGETEVYEVSSLTRMTFDASRDAGFYDSYQVYVDENPLAAVEPDTQVGLDSSTPRSPARPARSKPRSPMTTTKRKPRSPVPRTGPVSPPRRPTTPLAAPRDVAAQPMRIYDAHKAPRKKPRRLEGKPPGSPAK